MLGAILLGWGYVFYLCSLTCFTLVKVYVTVLDALVVQPLEWFLGVEPTNRVRSGMPETASMLLQGPALTLYWLPACRISGNCPSPRQRPPWMRHCDNNCWAKTAHPT